MIEFEGLPESMPELVNPVMLCAFEGWNDAGESATAAVIHLEEAWDAVEVGEFDPEDYYDFQVNRPEVSFEDDERVVTWPTTRLSVARIPLATRDVVLVHGIEPSMHCAAHELCPGLRSSRGISHAHLVQRGEECQCALLLTRQGAKRAAREIARRPQGTRAQRRTCRPWQTRLRRTVAS